MTGDELKTKIENTRSVWRKCIRGDGRFRDYQYLDAVYRLYSDIRSNKLSKLAFVVLAGYSKKKISRDTHLIRALLDATCKADPKVKSRWTRALRYAWRQREHWDCLAIFFRRNGGISGCANYFTETRRWKKERPGICIRVPSDKNVRMWEKLHSSSLNRLAIGPLRATRISSKKRWAWSAANGF